MSGWGEGQCSLFSLNSQFSVALMHRVAQMFDSAGPSQAEVPVAALGLEQGSAVGAPPAGPGLALGLCLDRGLVGGGGRAGVLASAAGVRPALRRVSTAALKQKLPRVTTRRGQVGSLWGLSHLDSRSSVWAGPALCNDGLSRHGRGPSFQKLSDSFSLFRWLRSRGARRRPRESAPSPQPPARRRSGLHAPA